MDWLLQPWPWYISGPLIGLMVPALLILSGKTFGISSSFQHLGSMCAPRSKLPYLKNNNWRQSSWSLVFVLGVILGASLGANFLSAAPVALLPGHYYSLGGATTLLLGGLLVGFGVRYANGCTSGHTIMGLSNLQWSSLAASVSFFIGGLIMTFFIL